jgi:hypothetical protein
MALHPIPLLSSYSLLSFFPHSSTFHTYDQKKGLENEPGRKGHGRGKLSRRPGEGPGRTRSQGEESQGGGREKKELEPERRREASQSAR